MYTLARAINERRIELKTKSTAGIILSLEENHLSLLRNLRFKHFFVAVASATLETILGRKIAADTVAFSPTAASISTNSIEALVAGWSPVVEAVLAYVSTKVDPEDFGNKLSEEGFLPDVATHVAAMLYAGKASAQFAEFSKMVSDS